ncbi:DNA-3-methyladenine glycosylase I [Nonomuraea rubra]
MYLAYHDEEWGAPSGATTRRLRAGVSLEAFQSGLSWLTILRKRENFRAAFDRFSIPKVAAYTEQGRRAHCSATRASSATGPRSRRRSPTPGPRSTCRRPVGAGVAARRPRRARAEDDADVPAVTPGSKALAKELKKRGFRFVGPTTAYALMQAIGLVNDHLEECVARSR